MPIFADVKFLGGDTFSFVVFSITVSLRLPEDEAMPGGASFGLTNFYAPDSQQKGKFFNFPRHVPNADGAVMGGSGLGPAVDKIPRGN
jgi:hypothetical protein